MRSSRINYISISKIGFIVILILTLSGKVHNNNKSIMNDATHQSTILICL